MDLTPKIGARRDGRLDFLRGVCLMVMTIDHLPATPLHRVSYETTGYITAAGGFILISGITCGWVYSRATDATRRILARCGLVYVTYLLLTLLVWLTSPAAPGATESWHDLLLIVAGTPGRLAGPAGLLSIYVVLLLMLPFILRLFKAGYAFHLLSTSFGLWLLAQWRIGPQVGFGYILAWQFLFVAGSWLGYCRNRGIRLPGFLSRNGLTIGAVGCLIFFLLRHPIVHPPILGLGWGITSKETLGAARLSNISLFALLIASIPRALDVNWSSSVVYRAGCFLGRHSLQVFAGHVLIVQGFVRYAAAWSNASLGLQALMAMVALSLLFIPAYAHHRYRRWSDSIVSGKRGRPTTSLSKATVSVAHLSRERANFRGRLLGSEQESEVARNSVEVSDSRPS